MYQEDIYTELCDRLRCIGYPKVYNGHKIEYYAPEKPPTRSELREIFPDMHITTFKAMYDELLTEIEDTPQATIDNPKLSVLERIAIIKELIKSIAYDVTQTMLDVEIPVAQSVTNPIKRTKPKPINKIGYNDTIEMKGLFDV